MALPKIAIVLGLGGALAAVGAYFAFHKKGAAGKDGSLPDDLQKLQGRLLTEAKDGDALDIVAGQMNGYGYTKEAQDLYARAQVLKAKNFPGQAPAAPAYIPPEAPAAPAYVPPPEAPAAPAAAPVSRVASAIVTTADPPPAGDLIVRSAANGTAKQIGGAEKNGEVDVLEWATGDSGAWAKISWRGGSRWPAVTGYAKVAYLSPSGYTQVSGSIRYANVGARGLSPVLIGCERGY